MKITPTVRSRRAGAAVAIGALTLSGLVFASPAEAAAKIITSNMVDQGNTRATGHNVFLEDGVHVYTEGNTNTGPRTDGGAGNWNTDKAAGYIDVAVDLSEGLDAAMSWRNTSSALTARPGTQLRVDLDDDGTNDGILVGEPVYGDNWWLSEGNATAKNSAPHVGGGNGSEWFGTLAEWSDEFPAASIRELGWSLGSGVHGDGIIERMTLGGDDYYFTDGVTEKLLYKSDVDTSSTRSAGHNTFRPTGGVRTWTDDNTSEGKAAGLFDVDVPLDEAGEPVMRFRTNSGDIPPGLWLQVDADDDGDIDGTLIGEASYYGNDWWLNEEEGVMYDDAPSTEGGSGSNRHGTLAGWSANFPDAQILKSGWSLGSGVQGDFIVDSITVGLTKYTFTGKNRAPSAVDAEAATEAGAPVTVSIEASDPDGEELTFDAASGNGSVEFDGAELTYTPDSTFVGTDSFDYIVTDERGGEATGSVTVFVGQAKGSTSATVSPVAPTTRSYIKVTASIVSTGSTAGGRAVYIVDSKRLATRLVNSAGTSSYTLTKRLSRGKHKIQVHFEGTDSVRSGTRTITVTVR